MEQEKLSPHRDLGFNNCPHVVQTDNLQQFNGNTGACLRTILPENSEQASQTKEKAQDLLKMLKDSSNEHHQNAERFQHYDYSLSSNTFRREFRHRILFEEDFNPSSLERIDDSTVHDECSSSSDTDLSGIQTFVLFEGRVNSAPVKTEINSSPEQEGSDAPVPLLEKSYNSSFVCDEKIIPFYVIDKDESNFGTENEVIGTHKNSADGIPAPLNTNYIQVRDKNEASDLDHEDSSTPTFLYEGIGTSFHVNQESDLQFLVYEDQLSPSFETFEEGCYSFEDVNGECESLKLEDDLPTPVVIPSIVRLEDDNLRPKIDSQVEGEAVGSVGSQSDLSKRLDSGNVLILDRKDAIVPKKIEAIDLLFATEPRKKKEQKSIVYQCKKVKNEKLEFQVTRLRAMEKQAGISNRQLGKPTSSEKTNCNEEVSKRIARRTRSQGKSTQLKNGLGNKVKNVNPINIMKQKKLIIKVNVCEICSKRFDRVGNLKNHYIEHVISDKLASRSSGEKVLFECPRCPAGADVLCLDTRGLKQHLRAHAGLTLYLCDVCQKTFSNSSNFSKHKKVHGAPYTCDICDKKFFTLKMLAHHEKLHDEIGIIPCSICSSQFYSMSQLKRHTKAKHACGPTVLHHRRPCKRADSLFKILQDTTS